MGNAEFTHVYRCAQRSVHAWGDAIRKYGSLLQNWIGGNEVREHERYPDPDVADRRHGYQFFIAPIGILRLSMVTCFFLPRYRFRK